MALRVASVHTTLRTIPMSGAYQVLPYSWVVCVPLRTVARSSMRNARNDVGEAGTTRFSKSATTRQTAMSMPSVRLS